MFGKKIVTTPLTRAEVDGFFNIGGDGFSGDISFTATLRALLHERSNGAAVHLSVRGTNCYGYGAHTFTDFPEVFRSLDLGHSENNVEIRNLEGIDEDIASMLSILDDPDVGLAKIFSNFHEEKDLAAFVQRHGKFDARFYVNEAEKKVLIVCDRLSSRGYHFIQSLIPRLLPWFFVEKPIDDTELELLDSLTSRTAEKYERILTRLADRIDLRKYAVKNIIGDFEKLGRREEIQNTTREIRKLRNDIEELQRRYQGCCEKLDEMSIRLNGQEMALQAVSDSSELIDYFICNRNIDPVSVCGHKLCFTVKTFFEAFDPEQYRTYISKPTSFLYEGYGYQPEFAETSVRRKMLDAIFSDEPILKIKTCANYVIDLRGIIEAYKQYSYGEAFADYVPNPHIHYFACLGNYAPYIRKLIQDGNIIGAIEQCVTSAKSLNVSEGITVRHFLDDIFTSIRRIIRLPDGRDVTPVEALEYLNSMETQKEDDNA